MVKLYADVPARRARQLAGDIWLVVWTLCWIWIAVKLHGLIMSLAAPGQAIADGATGKPRLSTKLRARTLSPIKSMVSGRGPMKAMPASSQALANPAFSDRKP